ncbi:Vms1/Ankzf1 family peptidyl-tRNA hydrolase [Brachybacterium sp. YJGR34]|uniref:baeRF2 domain-containing protein n=1 Tax=Brachybacterium sp. YJGR34 TaxID=2059911 RepID=UPI000E0C9F96|nr:Vms1/Ankzf1 family peptidyl-tRNA hydrolase [Brachybacterium sp. YJGR34]
MKLPWLKSALEHPGPFVSVHLDTTRTDPHAAAELEMRWSQMRSALAADGAPEALLTQIEETVLSPSPIGGRHGRTIIASDAEILVDRVLPVPPLQESGYRGEFPQLLPLLQLTPFAVSQLLIVVDRAGADLHLRAPENPSITQGTNGLGEDATVEGGHDELHKANLGGGSQHGWRANNFEARVEDSWERNADAVAEAVDRIVREHSPDMVLLSGDVRAMALCREAIGHEVRERIQEVPGGTRGVALDRESFREEVARVTGAFIEDRQRELAARFHESQARDGASVGGAAEVAQALERGQVEELIFTAGRDVAGLEELARRALLTDASVSALEEEHDGLPEGVGALLRWRDGATPSNRVGSMSHDTRREEAVDPARDEDSPHRREEQSLGA